MKIRKGLALLIGLVFQFIAGALAFMVVVLLAAGIYSLIHLLEKHGLAPVWLVTGAGWVEVGIFIFDCVMFALFLLTELIKFGITLFEDLKSHGQD